MADRRMFAKSIVLSDTFMDMPAMSRALYFTLGMFADDDGVVGNPKGVMRQCGATDEDMEVLKQLRYVLVFPSGVIVIKHWPINNYIRDDRHKRTTYVEEMSTLTIDEKGAYTEKNKICQSSDGQVSVNCQPSDNQVREVGIPSIGKVSIGKVSIGKDKDILSDTSDHVHQIIDYLNLVLGTSYTYRSKSTNEKIKARLAEGHTVDDFKTVIDKKHAEWGHDQKMAKYLRPETLFAASHFESYLNAPARQTLADKWGIDYDIE